MANSNISESESPSGIASAGTSRGSSISFTRASGMLTRGEIVSVIRPSRTHCSRIANGLSIALKPIGNRHPAISTESARRNFHTGSGLTTFVLIRVDHANHAPHEFFIESHVQHL